MTVTDGCNALGIPRPQLNAIAMLASEILSLSGPSAPRKVVCWDGPAEVLSHDELEDLHNRIDAYSAVEEVPRLLATVEALREPRS